MFRACSRVQRPSRGLAGRRSQVGGRRGPFGIETFDVTGLRALGSKYQSNRSVGCHPSDHEAATQVLGRGHFVLDFEGLLMTLWAL